jgi:hypothetical protein
MTGQLRGAIKKKLTLRVMNPRTTNGGQALYRLNEKKIDMYVEL